MVLSSNRKTSAMQTAYSFALASLLITMISCNSNDKVVFHVWQHWEVELTTDKKYDNPYKDVLLTVEFTGPGNEKFTSAGFWSEGSQFLIRSAFPTAGTWRWETTCSDKANEDLHQRSGEVTVVEYTGDHPLYSNGFLRVSDNKRYLTYHNKKPFLWVGGTAWIAPLRASLDDWKTYIDDRAAKKFSVIQISPASNWGGAADIFGETAFNDTTLSQWNPGFWKEYDKKVRYANEQGLVILIVGLMEPVDRYPSAEAASIFARNLAARMSGSFVIFSPSFDSPFAEIANVVGDVLNKADSRHLITQHPGTPTGALIHTIADQYYNEEYLDFSMSQSGHNLGRRNYCVWQAIHWNVDLYKRNKKPVINGEAYYEADSVFRSTERKTLGTASDARQLGYMSFLSGALGYTYGAYGLWNWETDSAKRFYWKKAIQYPGATHMKYLADFFAGLEWWNLEPRHDLILNQSTDTLSLMTLARSSERDLLVAYLPKTDKIRINLEDFSFPARERWFDPIRSKYIEGRQRRDVNDNEFLAPGISESLLILEKE